MDVAQRKAEIIELTDRIFHHEDFDDPDKSKLILGPMPGQQDYLREAVLLRATANKGDDIFHACFDQPLLNREQEFHLFRKYNYCKYRARKCLPLGGLLQAENWMAQVAEINKLLMSANVRLGVNFVKKYKVTNLYEDLISETYCVLARTITCFDWRKGVKFSTYLTWAIHNQITREVGKNYHTHGKNISLEEASLENKRNQSTEFQDIENFNHCKETVESLMDCLEEKEETVVRLLFFKEWTLEQAGNHIGLTKERARQIKVEALRKMREKAMERSETAELCEV